MSEEKKIVWNDDTLVENKGASEGWFVVDGGVGLTINTPKEDRIRVNKRTHFITYENESEESVDVVVRRKE